jgi:PAS domain S-box-containing protein
VRLVPNVDQPELHRRALGHVEDMVMALDREFRLVYLNPAGERVLAEHAGGATLDRDVREIYPGIRGTDREAAVLRVLAGGPAETLRANREPLGGWVEMRIHPDPVGAIITVSNIAGRVEIERRTQLEAAVLDAVAEGIYGVDTDNRITFVNSSAEKLLGYRADEIIGLNSHQTLHYAHLDGRPFPERDCPLTRTLVDGQPHTAADTLWRAGGEPLPVEYHTAAIWEGENVSGAVVSFSDLTDRLVAERAASAAAEALNALSELQQALQPPPPDTADPCLGVFYLPADVAGAGGDLYDWQVLPNDGMHIAVVDVVGKGLVAARDALAVTHALRLLVLAQTPLEKVIRQADWLLTDAYPDLAATAIVARYQQETGRLRAVSAGHPPPLLIHADGRTEYLDGVGRPLGWPDAGTDDVIDLEIPRGSRVLFYTDGLIEAGRDVTNGLSALAGIAAATRALPPGESARHIVEAVLADASRRDDCLALVLERPR